MFSAYAQCYFDCDISMLLRLNLTFIALKILNRIKAIKWLVALQKLVTPVVEYCTVGHEHSPPHRNLSTVEMQSAVRNFCSFEQCRYITKT
jgi:hypothetical protein